MSRPTPPAYKTRNWPAYNEALKRRGSLTIWFDPAMTWDAAPIGIGLTGEPRELEQIGREEAVGVPHLSLLITVRAAELRAVDRLAFALVLPDRNL